jgi:hypothetical protein
MKLFGNLRVHEYVTYENLDDLYRPIVIVKMANFNNLRLVLYMLSLRKKGSECLKKL